MQNYDLRFVKIGCFSGNMEYGGTIYEPICLPTFTRSVEIWAKIKII